MRTSNKQEIVRLAELGTKDIGMECQFICVCVYLVQFQSNFYLKFIPIRNFYHYIED